MPRNTNNSRLLAYACIDISYLYSNTQTVFLRKLYTTLLFKINFAHRAGESMTPLNSVYDLKIILY